MVNVWQRLLTLDEASSFYEAFEKIYEAFGQIYEAFGQIYELRGCGTGLSYHTPLVVYRQARKVYPAPCCSGV